MTLSTNRLVSIKTVRLYSVLPRQFLAAKLKQCRVALLDESHIPMLSSPIFLKSLRSLGKEQHWLPIYTSQATWHEQNSSFEYPFSQHVARRKYNMTQSLQFKRALMLQGNSRHCSPFPLKSKPNNLSKMHFSPSKIVITVLPLKQISVSQLLSNSCG